MRSPESNFTSSQHDAELLGRYAGARSEEAFTELVRRHIGRVYHAALRRTSHAQMAEDATQRVFTVLARNSAAVSRHAVLVGWLHTTTRFEVNKLIRTERRRRAREQEAFALQDPISDAGTRWEQLQPVIADVIALLPERERAAVRLRFFEERSFARVGAAIQLSEDAARKRVERGILRLRSLLAKRGITSNPA